MCRPKTCFCKGYDFSSIEVGFSCKISWLAAENTKHMSKAMELISILPNRRVQLIFRSETCAAYGLRPYGQEIVLVESSWRVGLGSLWRNSGAFHDGE